MGCNPALLYLVVQLFLLWPLTALLLALVPLQHALIIVCLFTFWKLFLTFWNYRFLLDFLLAFVKLLVQCEVLTVHMPGGEFRGKSQGFVLDSVDLTFVILFSLK